MKKVNLRKRSLPLAFFVIVIILVATSRLSAQKVMTIYKNRQSTVITDRYNKIILLRPNQLGYYAEYSTTVPQHFRELVLAQEDRYFYFHPGFNPMSIARAAVRSLLDRSNRASSTITQQLVKLLLSQENERTFKNKLVELWYALSLELHLSKNEILSMYANSIYLGNNAQGITSASQLYFGKTTEDLTGEEWSALINTIKNPVRANPFAYSSSAIEEKKRTFFSQVNTAAAFEMSDEIKSDTCKVQCALTIDSALTENLRSILYRHIKRLSAKNVQNGALAVIKVPENELLALVGSPDPTADYNGYQINMAKESRPIGSTVKPFIYLKGFEKGLRPYTLVDDKEYKYTIGSGFAFYPKNFDYAYHGRVSLHFALTNSLNVPTVKVLEYIGLENFYNFLENSLGFQPIQPLESYQLGIALGGLEMDLRRLAHYLTIFPNGGYLRPLQLLLAEVDDDNAQGKQIADLQYVQLVNEILSDRTTGVEQFGIKSSLNLPYKNYAVKTGTSREFHDSWTIGYTPDFVVGVWLGNSDNTAMDAVSGATGAADIWHEAMNVLYQSPYNKNTPVDFSLIKEWREGDEVQYGLTGDDYKKARFAIADQSLILNPHMGDDFLWQPEKIVIPLRARREATWHVNDKPIGSGSEISFLPPQPDRYRITAKAGEEKEDVEIIVTSP